MNRRWKALAVACAAALAMPAGVAVAHDPEEFGGTPLTDPFGHDFWFFANFQTAANPYNAANTHVTSSDIAFWGNLAYVGDYGGFRIFDVSQPEPQLDLGRALLRAAGRPVGVRSRRRRRRRHARALGRQRAGRPAVRRRARRARTRPPARYPDGAWEGIRDLRHLRPDGAAADRDRLPGLRLAHEHAAARAGQARTASGRLSTSQLELSARRRPDLRPARRRAGPQGQPRRGPGRRDPVRRPVAGARAHRAAGRLPG